MIIQVRAKELVKEWCLRGGQKPKSIVEREKE